MLMKGYPKGVYKGDHSTPVFRMYVAPSASVSRSCSERGVLPHHTFLHGWFCDQHRLRLHHHSFTALRYLEWMVVISGTIILVPYLYVTSLSLI